MTGISQSSHCIFSASLSFSNDNENLFHHCHCALQLRCFENDRNTHLPKYFIENCQIFFFGFQSEPHSFDTVPNVHHILRHLLDQQWIVTILFEQKTIDIHTWATERGH